jgi:dTDP-4-dehydrorhamnose 3,5-epimerase
MNIIHTDIPEVIILEPRVFGDARGYFFESFRQDTFLAEVCATQFVQDNESRSCYGVVRGLHFQRPPYTQSKLVRVVVGAVLDVAVDIRVGSPTYGKYVAVELSADNKRQLFVPRGFAHGFSVLSDDAVFSYKCDNYYNAASEAALAWDDTDLAIDWRIPHGQELLSDKDKRHPSLRDFVSPFAYGDNYYTTTC